MIRLLAVLLQRQKPGKPSARMVPIYSLGILGRAKNVPLFGKEIKIHSDLWRVAGQIGKNKRKPAGRISPLDSPPSICHRQTRLRRCEKCLARGRRLAATRQSQRDGKIAFAGNAFLLADEPFRLRLDFRADGRAQPLRGRRDGGEQIDVAAITVGGERAHFVELRRGPLDGAGGEAGREGPLDGGGEACVARVDPVGVPVGVHVEMERDEKRAVGSDGGGFGNQLRRDVRLRDGGAEAGFRRGNRVGGARGEPAREEERAEDDSQRGHGDNVNRKGEGALALEIL